MAVDCNRARGTHSAVVGNLFVFCNIEQFYESRADDHCQLPSGFTNCYALHVHLAFWWS